MTGGRGGGGVTVRVNKVDEVKMTDGPERGTHSILPSHIRQK